MKYAVAYMNYFDNDLKLTTVEADNPITAMIEGVREMMEAPNDDEWLNEKLENIPSSNGYAERIKEIQGDFFDTDQAIAVIPIE